MQSVLRFLALAAAALPLLGHAAPVSQVEATQAIPGKWIIQLKPEANIATIATHKDTVRAIQARNLARRGLDADEAGGIEEEYGFGSFKGYSGSFDESTIEELKNLPEVSRCATLATHAS